ncbi:MAG: SpoIIE family protein phosphatase [Candidatus Latescibacteria bacterium]|nr:SpoIIE family protein phosphatase [Candidatus Latescibacterota bacterium]
MRSKPYPPSSKAYQATCSGSGRFVFTRLIGWLLLFSAPLQAEDTTLARLAFWVPPERKAEFETAYQTQVAPLLEKHGWTPSAQTGRTTADSVFSRLFAVPTPTAVAAQWDTLTSDTAWQALAQKLGAAFGTARTDGQIEAAFELYRAPAGPGRTVAVGPGMRRGLWHSLSLKDGVHFGIEAMLQDSADHLWLGSAFGGLSRFDGTHVTTFIPADGLVGYYVGALLKDRHGHIWIATRDGLNRYDGHHFETFTRADGLGHNEVLALLEDRAGRVWCGTAGGGVSRFDGTRWTTFTTADGLASNWVGALLQDERGDLWLGTGSYRLHGAGLSRFDGKEWITYTQTDGLGSDSIIALTTDAQGRVWVGTTDGASYFNGEGFIAVDQLADQTITTMVADQQGHLWVGIFNVGLYRFDGSHWAHFTFADGLANDQVRSLTVDQQGTLWVGTIAGLSRYDQGTWAHFTTAEGLPHNAVVSLLEDQHGQIWAGTFAGVGRYTGTAFAAVDFLDDWNVWTMIEDRQGRLWFGDGGNNNNRGVLRYDGAQTTHFPIADGLSDNAVWCLLEDQKGQIWAGSRTRGGISRFDGQTWTNFTTEDGLVANRVGSLLEDRGGHLWIAAAVGPDGGVSRYDGNHFTNFTTKDGLTNNNIMSMLEDRLGNLWFGTFGGGASRYDGHTWTTFSEAQGLTYNRVTALLEDRRGHLWFGTFGGGVSRYDGQIFQTLSRSDGLIFDTVHALLEDRQGNVWIGTEGGLSRYTPSADPPQVEIQAVIADQHYIPDHPIHVQAGQQLVLFEFQGRSWTTHPDQMAYVYRLQGHDADWKPAYTNRIEYQNLPAGEYLFEVRAVDRDLNYSKPAAVQLVIEHPYRLWALYGIAGLGLIGFVLASGLAVRRGRAYLREQQARLAAQQALNRELENELQTASDLQRGLMPEQSPQLAGFHIAGHCRPANHVSGDFFQYFQQPNGHLALCLADVTGHAMDAAIPMVQFAGVLQTEMQYEHDLAQLFQRLNHTLFHSLGTHTYVCFALAELDPTHHTARLSNAGCPFPLHYQAATGQVVEYAVGAYPLGARSQTEFPLQEVPLAPGDRLVLCSDGLAEAVDGARRPFGFERVSQVIGQGCAEGLGAEALIERLLDEVQTYSGNLSQDDDQTVVVVQVDEESTKG